MKGSYKRPADFNLRELYAALDAQRQSRGLSWSQATREMGPESRTTRARRISTSTVIGTRTRAVMEGDGVLQMLQWLNRTPESFMPDRGESQLAGEPLPQPAPHQTLRFDTKTIYDALEAQRADRGLSWKQVAAEAGLGASTLTRLSRGGRTAFPHVMRIFRWLSQPAAQFVRVSNS
jgi:AraC-like DNA-binding protein